MTTDPKLIEREQKPREKFQKLWSEMVRNCEDEKYKQIFRHAEYLENELTALEHKLEVAIEGLEKIKRVNGMMGLGDALMLAETTLETIKGAKTDE